VNGCWSGALALARAYRGVPAFAAGLRLLPEGGDLARRLDLGDVRSLQHELRRESMVAAELDALLSASVGIRRKLAIASRRSFPRPDYMRWWSPLARRGKLGLAGAYVWRAIRVIGRRSARFTHSGASSEQRAGHRTMAVFGDAATPTAALVGNNPVRSGPSQPVSATSRVRRRGVPTDALRQLAVCCDSSALAA